MRSLGRQGLSRQHLREYTKHRTPMDPFAGGKQDGGVEHRLSWQ